MVYGVFGIVDALLHRLVAYVDGILPRLGEVRLIARHRHAFSLCRLHLPRRALGEGILAVGIGTLMKRKTGCGRGRPLLGPILHISPVAAVVVDDDLILLPVALAWREHHGTGILKHRDEIRCHYCLGV